MAFLTKKEFSERCGMVSNKLSVYIKRGKVILSGDLIDETDPKNQLFLKQQSIKVRKTQVVEASNDEIKNNVSTQSIINPEILGIVSLEKKQKELAVEKTKAEIDILNDKRDKNKGASISYDHAKNGIGQNLRDTTVFITQGLSNWMAELAIRYKWNQNDKAEHNTRMIEIVNEGIDRGLDATIKTLSTIQKEYSKNKL